MGNGAVLLSTDFLLFMAQEVEYVSLPMDQLLITTFYRFLPLSPEVIQSCQRDLEAMALKYDLRGLCLLGSEGINATISCHSKAGMSALKAMLQEQLNTNTISFKDSLGSRHPFQVFKVKIKSEIVSLGRPDLRPVDSKNNHLSPSEWEVALSQPDTVVIDTRNHYEVKIGKFKNAIDFNLNEFNEFPDKIHQSGIDKDKRVLMYCTGGIRCEKALLEMREQGYRDVYQLEGGILNYLNEYPNQNYSGECFVFDYRVALDQNLQPSKQYRLCPHCGQTALEPITCSKCGRAETVCRECLGKEAHGPTCSKNCAHHAAIGSDSRKVHLQELAKRQHTK